MYVIRLPDGRLRVPQSLVGDEGRLIGDGYVEISPGDPGYERLLEGSLTEAELDERRQRWREEDDELVRRFLAFRAEQDG